MKVTHNPAFERDAAEARRPSTSRWASQPDLLGKHSIGFAQPKEIRMYNKFDRLIALLFVTSLAACASAPPLTEAASRVRFISAEQAKSCKFVKVVQYTDRILSMGKNATVMRAIGEAGLRNEAGTTGANALVITKNESEWFLGNVGYTGEAFNCPE